MEFPLPSLDHSGECLVGDLIAFRGRGLLAAGIQLATGSLPGFGLSHVAVVVQAGQGLPPLIAESTSLSRTACLWTGKRTLGVQVHSLVHRMLHYHGKIWHYPTRGVWPTQGEVKLEAFVRSTLGTAYDPAGAFHCRSTPLNWLRRKLLGSRENRTSLFCSEFVAAAWQAAGVWDPPNISEWSPNQLVRTATQTGIVGMPRRIK